MLTFTYKTDQEALVGIKDKQSIERINEYIKEVVTRNSSLYGRLTILALFEVEAESSINYYRRCEINTSHGWDIYDKYMEIIQSAYDNVISNMETQGY